ncbi:CoA-disulfide reductase, partial [Enterococcus faecalis]
MKVLIVGGVAGGMSAATRLRRLMEDAEIIVLEKGPYVSFANCGLPYFIAGEITTRDQLLL